MIQDIQKIFIKHVDPKIAQQQKQYMRNQFEFFGIPHPKRRQLIKPLLKKSLTLSSIEVLDLILSLFNLPYREYHYTAIDFFITHYQHFSYENIQQLYPLLETHPWWDSIDGLQKPFSLWVKTHPQYLYPICLYWNQQESIWFKRSALIIQLNWKQNTDTELLSTLILSNSNSSEFFIQKAIGWILREYSKTNKEWVQHFILNNQLSKLSYREAHKYL